MLLGLQEYFNITQFQLLDKVGIKRDNTVSFWISGRRDIPYKQKVKFLEFISKNSLNIDELIKFGEKIRGSIKFNGQWFSTKNALTKKASIRRFLLKKRDPSI